MSLNSTPSGERVHIGFFGRRNAGKSSVVNAVTNQQISVVSDVKGTTTDPVQKAMELLPLGPVMIIDTPGFDDEGSLGEQRVKRTKQVLNRTDIAVLVVDGTVGKTAADEELIGIFRQKDIPYIVAYNKCDESGMQICADLVGAGELAVLVVPIDKAAPKGRLILPQQQTIRDLLDSGAAAVVARDSELAETLSALGKKPALVITDSQVFGKVKDIVPDDVPLTSFSILMARYKGFLETAVKGAAAIENLRDGDTVLISEGCTHHRQCDDIGTVKLPRWLKAHTGKDINIETTSGKGYPDDLSPFKLIIHCGGCMLNEREMTYRRKSAEDSGVPFTNYGTAIAYLNGILKRTLSVFPDLQKLV